MAALSLLLSVMSVLTLWLIIPVFVLPPLAFFIGYKAYRASRSRKLLSCVPMAVAVAAFFLDVYILSVGYRP